MRTLSIVGALFIVAVIVVSGVFVASSPTTSTPPASTSSSTDDTAATYNSEPVPVNFSGYGNATTLSALGSLSHVPSYLPNQPFDFLSS